MKARTQAGGDVALSWIRRTRIDGDIWQGAEVPLGEDSESYLVRVMSGASEVRQATVATPSWTYSSAMQAADGVAAPYHLEVAQISTRFGPGLFRRETVWS